MGRAPRVCARGPALPADTYAGDRCGPLLPPRAAPVEWQVRFARVVCAGRVHARRYPKRGAHAFWRVPAAACGVLLLQPGSCREAAGGRVQSESLSAGGAAQGAVRTREVDALTHRFYAGGAAGTGDGDLVWNDEVGGWLGGAVVFIGGGLWHSASVVVIANCLLLITYCLHPH